MANEDENKIIEGMDAYLSQKFPGLKSTENTSAASGSNPDEISQEELSGYLEKKFKPGK